jgi:glycosyltransferase involved in cell wall biosynthesis
LNTQTYTVTVLHVLTSLDFGGVENRMLHVAEHCKKHRFNHVFCSLADGGSIEDALGSLGCAVYVLGANPKIPSFSAIYHLIVLIKKLRPDVIHLHGAEANFHGVLAAKICRVPVCICEEIGIPTHKSFKTRYIFRVIYSMADKVIAISHAVKNRVIELGEATQQKVAVIYNPARIQRERICSLHQEGTLRLGFVGRLEPIKNPVELVHAVATLRDRGYVVELLVVGDGSLRGAIESAVTSLNLSAEVKLLGYQSRPFDCLRGCEYYVQPSVTEGFGLAIVEAMSMGMAVLGTPYGGVPEIIEDGHNGWILGGIDSQSIADDLIRVSSLSLEVRRDVTERGRMDVVNRYSIESYLGHLEDLYDENLATNCY